MRPPFQYFQVLGGFADLPCLGYFQRFAGLHILDVAVNGDTGGHRWEPAYAFDFFTNTLRLVCDSEPFDELSRARAGNLCRCRESCVR